MNTHSQSRLAVVTGAGSGIGKAVALAFAAQGDRVIAADLDEAAAAATAKEQPELITALPVDVADPAQVDALRDRTHAEVGVPNIPNIIVNAAGWDRTDQFLNATPEFAAKVVAINYLGPVHVCSAFLPGMIEAHAGGRVVNLASDAGRVGSAGNGPPPDHGELRVPGPDGHAAFSRATGEAERSADQGDPVSSAGPARGGRRTGAVLRIRRRVVHHGTGDQCQRRPDNGRLVAGWLL
jgi:NAD(P)-dependent dehydrogenase (short-subunit alcohol dehydrogenase family)